MEAIKGIAGEASRSTRTVPAVCTRVDGDGTAWVRAVGSSEDTPIDGASTSVVEAGDMVNVDVNDGTATIVGNMTSPSVGSVQLGRVADSADRMFSKLGGSIDIASGIAGAAERVAKAINQHFWTDNSGIHVTQATREEWQASNSGPNVLINSLGQLFRDGLNNLLSLLPAQTQTDTFTGDGTTTTFTLSETPISITSVTVGGTATVAYSISGTTLTFNTAPVSDSEVVVAYRTSNSNVAIFDGNGNTSSNVIARFGEDGAQIGYDGASHMTITPEHMAMTNYSGTSELFWIDANTGSFSNGIRGSVGHDGGRYSGTFGLGNVAKPSVDGEMDFGVGAFAHGSGCSAYGDGAFAGGKTAVANQAAFAHGYHVIAARRQAVVGQYNVEDTSNEYLFIVGNGKSDTSRSNAYAVAWDGTVTHATDVSAQALPLSSAVQAYSDAQAPHYSRWGNVVHLVGAVKPTSEVAAGGSVTIGTLPEGCRPAQELDILCQGSTNHTWLLRVYPSGEVAGERYRNGATNDAMPTNAWLTFSATFLV